MEIVYRKLNELKPYENNPRINEEAVEYVANSIKEFGFKVPLVITADGVIVAGHTRYQASKELGLSEVPCIVADDLTDEQIKAFRIADNKTASKSAWDYDKLKLELEDIDMNMLDFGFEEFELSMIMGDYMPERYDEELVKQYSEKADDFLENKRIIITYRTEEETEFIKRLIKEEGDLGVVYKVADVMRKYDE